MARLSSRARRAEIVRLATTMGLTSVDELSSVFEVTASTIRRDLATLHAGGQLARTYGGAIPAAAHPEASLRHRLGEAYREKQAIARWCAPLIRPGHTVLLDAGSTVAALAIELRAVRDITVVTTSLTVVECLADIDGITLECLGGTFRQLSQGFVGTTAESALERFTFDLAFLGADAVSADYGICEADLRQVRLKEMTAARSRRVYVLAHAAKLGRTPFHSWAPLQPPWTIVTDDAATPEQRVAFATRNQQLVIVEASGH